MNLGLLSLSIAGKKKTTADTAIYISSSGNDTTGTGATGAPYATLAKALTVATTGSTIRLKTNITLPDTSLYAGITISTASLTIESDTPGTRRTLNMAAMNSANATGGEGIRITASGVTLRGLHFTLYDPDFGGSPADYNSAVNIRGTNGFVDNCEFSYIAGRGLTIGEGASGAGTVVTNSDFHHCKDPSSSSPYGNADGCQVFTSSGQTGIVFNTCRAWANSDDGWDLFFCDVAVTFNGCWAFGNGYRADEVTAGGDGNGFKVGGASHNGVHILNDCLAMANREAGFTTNDNTGAVQFNRCTAINNGTTGTIYPASFIADGSSTATLTNCVKYGIANYFGGSVTQSYNSWNTPPGLGDERLSWFGANAMVATGLDDARDSSGTLPVVNDGRPATGSVLLTASAIGGVIGWTGTALEAGGTDPVMSGTFSFVAIGAQALAATNGWTGSEPFGSAAGDLIIAPIATRGSVALTLPSTGGWTLQEQQASANIDTVASTSIAGVTFAWCIRGSSAPSYAFGKTGGDVSAGKLIAYRPPAGLTVYCDDSSSETAASNTSTPGTAALDVPYGNSLVIACLGGGDNVGGIGTFDAATDPAGASSTTELTTVITAGTWKLRTQGSTSNGADTAYAAADAIKSTAGNTGRITCGAGVSSRHAVAAAVFSAR
jgi:hypothetical protein